MQTWWFLWYFKQWKIKVLGIWKAMIFIALKQNAEGLKYLEKW